MYHEEIFPETKQFLQKDIKSFEKKINKIIQKSSFLILGAAGSIGRAVTVEVFKKNPKKLHIIDINDNNFIELVRTLRSKVGYISGEFKTFSIDINSKNFLKFISQNNKYDYVLNFSAMKHIRSEKDIYSLMRMIEVNISNTILLAEIFSKYKVKKFFSVSSDKAVNPKSIMGASKRYMELIMLESSKKVKISSARFANVSFSDGSLLDGFSKRYEKSEPFSAPNNIKRYFISHQQAANICLISCLFGKNREIFFPKIPVNKMHFFSDIAKKFLKIKGYKILNCRSENQARKSIKYINKKKWPCYFFNSSTEGEKEYEEFYYNYETKYLNLYKDLGVVKYRNNQNYNFIKPFKKFYKSMILSKKLNRDQIINFIQKHIKDLNYNKQNKNLDQIM
tara:strand:- start:770 stop:1951 length:1182 start_codon:yes stop_codon:yes gene_type:complete